MCSAALHEGPSVRAADDDAVGIADDARGDVMLAQQLEGFMSHSSPSHRHHIAIIFVIIVIIVVVITHR